MPFIELRDPTGQVHTCESSQLEVLICWTWEMISKYAHLNRGKPAIEIRMTALTVELPDRVLGPDWIRGYPEELEPIPGDTPAAIGRAFITRLQQAITEAELDEAAAMSRLHALTERRTD